MSDTTTDISGLLKALELAPPPPKNTRTSPTRAQKERARAAAGYRCQLCKRGGPLTVHHVKPKSKGGKHNQGNLRVLCDVCHAQRHQCPAASDASQGGAE